MFQSEEIYFDSEALGWDTAIVVTVADASFAQEKICEPDGGEKPHRTQKAFADQLFNPDLIKNDKGGCCPWAWRSLTGKSLQSDVTR